MRTRNLILWEGPRRVAQRPLVLVVVPPCADPCAHRQWPQTDLLRSRPAEIRRARAGPSRPGLARSQDERPYHGMDLRPAPEGRPGGLHRHLPERHWHQGLVYLERWQLLRERLADRGGRRGFYSS